MQWRIKKIKLNLLLKATKPEWGVERGAEINTTGHFKVVLYSLKEPSILAFLCMLTDTNHLSKHPCWSSTTQWHQPDNMVPSCRAVCTDTLTHTHKCSGTAWEMWHRAPCLKMPNNFQKITIHGVPLSETIFGWVLEVQEHPHEYQDTRFPTRTLNWSHDQC